MSAPMMFERRVVCNTCGQQQGLFHKDCSGRWVTQQRAVTPWALVADALPDVPTDSLRRLVERARRAEGGPAS